MTTMWRGLFSSRPPKRNNERRDQETPNAPMQYLLIQGGRRQRLTALEPPKVPKDLLVLDENMGLDIEPYPSWTDQPPAAQPVSEPVRYSWPLHSPSSHAA